MREQSRKCKQAWKAFKGNFQSVKTPEEAIEGLKLGEGLKFSERRREEFQTLARACGVGYDAFRIGGKMYVRPALDSPVYERECLSCGAFAGWWETTATKVVLEFNEAGRRVSEIKYSSGAPVERLCKFCGSNLNSSLGERPR